MSERNEAYEEVQRYHVYNVGGEDTYCRDEDVAELEAVHQKLLQAHTIMKEALEWLTTDACLADYSHMSKRDFAVKTLKRVTEVMP